MSAFIVSKAHVDAIVDVASSGPKDRGPRYPGDGWHSVTWSDGEGNTGAPAGIGVHLDSRHDQDLAGQLLWRACYRSVSYRYPDHETAGLPGPVDFSSTDVTTYTFTRPARRLTTVEALKAIRCLEYQSCESPEWRASTAALFCQHLTNSLIASLPGYDDAAWEIE